LAAGELAAKQPPNHTAKAQNNSIQLASFAKFASSSQTNSMELTSGSDQSYYLVNGTFKQ